MASINRLTDRSIKAKNKRGMYSDGDGFYLQVSKTGSKSWVFRFKRGGKARDMGLGSYPAVPLAEARKKAQEARQQRDLPPETPWRPKNGAQTHAGQPSRNAPSN